MCANIIEACKTRNKLYLLRAKKVLNDFLHGLVVWERCKRFLFLAWQSAAEGVLDDEIGYFLGVPYMAKVHKSVGNGAVRECNDKLA